MDLSHSPLCRTSTLKSLSSGPTTNWSHLIAVLQRGLRLCGRRGSKSLVYHLGPKSGPESLVVLNKGAVWPWLFSLSTHTQGFRRHRVLLGSFSKICCPQRAPTNHPSPPPPIRRNVSSLVFVFTFRNGHPRNPTTKSPSVDYTSAEYITLLFTDLGVLTPSAVSDELIRLYGEA